MKQYSSEVFFHCFLQRLEFVNTQIDSLKAKAEKAKARAAEKRAQGDELRKVVKSVLTEEYQTADQIMEQIDGEDLTKSKIIARLTQLIKNNDAEKKQLSVDGKKAMAYKIISSDN